MFSRIFVGVHYPSDTIGGFLEGISILLLTYPTYIKYQEKSKKTNWYQLVFINVENKLYQLSSFWVLLEVLYLTMTNKCNIMLFINKY